MDKLQLSDKELLKLATEFFDWMFGEESDINNIPISAPTLYDLLKKNQYQDEYTNDLMDIKYLNLALRNYTCSAVWNKYIEETPLLENETKQTLKMLASRDYYTPSFEHYVWNTDITKVTLEQVWNDARKQND